MNFERTCNTPTRVATLHVHLTTRLFANCLKKALALSPAALHPRTPLIHALRSTCGPQIGFLEILSQDTCMLLFFLQNKQFIYSPMCDYV